MTRNPRLWASILALFFSGFSIQALCSPTFHKPSEHYLNSQVHRQKAPVDEIAPAWLTERRVIGENNLEIIIASPDTESASPSRSVARVESTDGKGYCTAARVGRNLFLTNFHCYEFVDCEDVQFHLGYEKNLPESQQKTFRCAEVLAFNERFDYALYRVDLSAPSQSSDQGDQDSLESSTYDDLADLADYPIATLWTGRLEVDQPLLVASHPRARLKEVDRSDGCKLLSIEPEQYLGRETITHACDTEGGSSGSPVFDRKTGRIVALHWGGTDEYNMAVPMSLIVQDWRSILSNEVMSELRIEK